MFGGTNKKEIGKPGSAAGATGSVNSFNTLVTGTLVEGTIKSEKDIRIEGAVTGKLYCDTKVVIGPTGHVEGEIRCANAVIEGRFEGNLFVSELLNIRDSAHVSGEVTTNRLVVQSGATFNVACTMTGGMPAKPSVQQAAKSSLSSSEADQQRGQASPAAGKSE